MTVESLIGKLRSVLVSRIPPAMLMRLVAWHDYWAGELELRLLRTLVPAERNVVDVGANYGVYAYYLSSLTKQLFAYEPNPDLATHLRKACPRNVVVREVALSHATGRAKLTVPCVQGQWVHGFGTLGNNRFQGAVRSLDVNLCRLDDEALPDIGFMKIDVEGHEEFVLAGGRGFISKNKPRLLVEIEASHLSKPVADVIEFVEGLGYRGAFFKRVTGERIDCVRCGASEIRAGTCDITGVVNYFFVPHDDFFEWKPAEALRCKRPKQ